MRCKDYKRWLSPYVDDRLTPQDRAQLDAHLAGCAGCRVELSSLRRMLQELRAMEPPAVPSLLPGIRQKLQRLPWWRQAMRRFAAPWPASLPLHGLALATTAVLIIVMVNLPGAFTRRNAALTRQYASKTPARAVAEHEAEQFEMNNERDEWAYRHLDAKPAAASRVSAGGDAQEPRSEAAGLPLNALTDAGSMTVIGGARQSEDALSVLPEISAERPASAVAVGASSRQTMNGMEGARRSRAIFEQAPDAVAQVETMTTFGKSGSLASHSPLGLDDTSASALTGRLDTDQAASAPIRCEWRVRDLQQAAVEVRAWVAARHGSVSPETGTRLRVILPASEAATFLQRFSTPTSELPQVVLASPPAAVPPSSGGADGTATTFSTPGGAGDALTSPTHGVTISLELVPVE